MLDINAFKPVIREKMLKASYMKLHKTMFPLGMAICDPRDFI